MRRRHLVALIASLICSATFAGTGFASPVQLLMVRDQGCGPSITWQREIGPAYDASPEGRAAPIQMIETEGPWPDGLALDRRPRVSPSFILVREGRETGRIEGYAGPERFWTDLRRLLAASGVPVRR